MKDAKDIISFIENTISLFENGFINDWEYTYVFYIPPHAPLNFASLSLPYHQYEVESRAQVGPTKWGCLLVLIFGIT